MAEDLKTALAEAVNEHENDTQKNESIQTDEVTNEGDEKPEEGKDVVKKEDIDWEAELQRKQEIIDKKNRAIETEKRKRKEAEEALKGGKVDVEEDDDIDERINSAVQNQIDGFKKSFVQDTIEDEINRVSSSEGEAKLIKFYLDNSIKLSGTSKTEIRDAVKLAKLAANEKRILTSNRELAEALKSHATMKTSAETSGAKQNHEKNEELSAEEKSFIDRYDSAAKKIHADAPGSSAK